MTAAMNRRLKIGARVVLGALAAAFVALLVAGLAGCSKDNPVAPQLGDDVECSSCPAGGYCPLACVQR